MPASTYTFIYLFIYYGTFIYLFTYYGYGILFYRLIAKINSLYFPPLITGKGAQERIRNIEFSNWKILKEKYMYTDIHISGNKNCAHTYELHVKEEKDNEKKTKIKLLEG